MKKLLVLILISTFSFTAQAAKTKCENYYLKLTKLEGDKLQEVLGEAQGFYVGQGLDYRYHQKGYYYRVGGGFEINEEEFSLGTIFGGSVDVVRSAKKLSYVEKRIPLSEIEFYISNTKKAGQFLVVAFDGIPTCDGFGIHWPLDSENNFQVDLENLFEHIKIGGHFHPLVKYKLFKTR